MPLTLMHTKVLIPPLQPNLLPRPHLIERLDRSLHPGLKLTLISAPAGYGKTTALIQWAHLSNASIGWFSLDDSDNELERFFRYLVLAWEAVQPEIRRSALDTLLSGLTPNSEAVLAAFINAADAVPDHTALILNDYHLIEEPSIHQALAFLLEHLPPKFHFVLVVRGEPPLPLSRYRARGEMQELGVAELRFRPEEASAFLSVSTGLAITPKEIGSLEQQLEGWVAGFQMSVIALKRGLATADKLAVEGRQRFIADYLREEVLANLEDDKRQFLLQTSLLERLCGPLCEAITEKEGGQAMLEALEKEGLFLLPLDARREWFRYHPLFAEYLSEELRSRDLEEVAGIHRRAARWYLAQELYEPAFDHAISGSDSQVVAEIAERRFDLLLHIGQHKLLRRWLGALPDAWQFQYPVIGLAQAQFLGMTGSVAACLVQVDRVEQAILESNREDRSWQLARVNTVRCNIACYQNDLVKAEPLAERALRDLPESDQHYRATVHHSLGEAYRHAGRWQEAREHYHKVLALVQDPAYRYRSTHIYGALADVELRQGKLRKAAHYWDRALSVIEERESWGYLPLPLTGWVYIRMAEILYEWNELEKVAKYVERGLERAEVGGVVQSLVVGYLIASRFQLTQGDVTAAGNYLERVRPYLEETPFHHWIGRYERLQTEIWLAQDKLRTAVNWSDGMLQDSALAQRPQNEIAYLAVARVLVYKGDGPALQQALNLLKRLDHTAGEGGRAAVKIESLALQALAYQKQGDEVRAMTAIEAALRLAEPEGYIRLFVDLGLQMARLLQAAHRRKVMADYVSRLLVAFDTDQKALDERPLPEPMTWREAEILKLIAAGLTNREIAAQLVISPETVKKHASNIYGKLSVTSRTEAVATARELGMLD